MTLLSSHVTCFGKFIGLCDFLVKLQMTADLFLIRGQYVHLPNLVQIGTCCEVMYVSFYLDCPSWVKIDQVWL